MFFTIMVTTVIVTIVMVMVTIFMVMIAMVTIVFTVSLLCDEEETLPVLELLGAAEEDVRVDLALEEVVGAEDGGAVVGLQPLDVEGGVQSLVVEVERLDVRLQARLCVTTLKGVKTEIATRACPLLYTGDLTIDTTLG